MAFAIGGLTVIVMIVAVAGWRVAVAGALAAGAVAATRIRYCGMMALVLLVSVAAVGGERLGSLRATGPSMRPPVSGSKPCSTRGRRAHAQTDRSRLHELLDERSCGR